MSENNNRVSIIPEERISETNWLQIYNHGSMISGIIGDYMGPILQILSRDYRGKGIPTRRTKINQAMGRFLEDYKK